MKRRLKVLVSVYACSPYQGSEPGVGWGFVSALGRHHDLWVIVEEEKFRADYVQRADDEHLRSVLLGRLLIGRAIIRGKRKLTS